jgi:hypothetical protein
MPRRSTVGRLRLESTRAWFETTTTGNRIVCRFLCKKEKKEKKRPVPQPVALKKDDTHLRDLQEKKEKRPK